MIKKQLGVFRHAFDCAMEEGSCVAGGIRIHIAVLVTLADVYVR